jgi:transcription antitermination factor NusA-like protein
MIEPEEMEVFEKTKISKYYVKETHKSSGKYSEMRTMNEVKLNLKQKVPRLKNTMNEIKHISRQSRRISP